jgi:hypothetical protein
LEERYVEEKKTKTKVTLNILNNQAKFIILRNSANSNLFSTLKVIPYITYSIISLFSPTIDGRALLSSSIEAPLGF